MTKSDDDSASARIDALIADMGDWRGETLRRVRTLIREADPDVVEEVKWVKPSNPAGVPTWSHDGTICTGETYKATVKLTFAHGASLEDLPSIAEPTSASSAGSRFPGRRSAGSARARRPGGTATGDSRCHNRVGRTAPRPTRHGGNR